MIAYVLLVGLIASASLADEPFYRLALWGQVLFYGAGALYAINTPGLRRMLGSGIPYYFCLVNGAALAGLWRALIATQRVTSTPTTR